MDYEIDLRDFIKALCRRKWLFVSLLFIAIITGGVISYIIDPTYEASAIITLGKFNNSVLTTPVSAKEVILSNEVLMEVMKKLEIEINEKNLKLFRNQIEVKDTRETSLLTITAEATEPVLAKDIARNLSLIFLKRALISFDENEKRYQDQLKKIKEQQDIVYKSLVRNKYVLARYQEQNKENSLSNDYQRNTLFEFVKNDEALLLDLQERTFALKIEMLTLEKPAVVSNAIVPEKPVKPNKILIIFIAAILSMIISLVLVFIREFFSKESLELTNLNC